MTATKLAVPTLVLLLAACGGDAGTPQSQPAEEGAAQTAAPATAEALPPIDISGPVDAELAARGEEIFRTKGCNACHKIGGGRLVGPDLLGVMDRREPEWVRAMVMHPDSMIKFDETAKQLFAEYLTPMTPLGISADDARALIEHFRASAEQASGS